ncbi:MAG: mechanosensitive ion channel [Corynebacterium sp.]|nr:mechanosensitive ion channel [Corynebacterium sp.]
MRWQNLVDSFTSWFVNHGISLILLVCVAFLIPRAGRYAFRFLTRSLGNKTQEDKTRRALFSTLIYLVQIVLYIITFITILRELGFALNGVTIPAAFISAAAALGAQSVVADFLAGFFILSEKQFGVGDWVHFQGSSVDVQGDVIKMTMRATTVRTSNGETVIVPNSAAKLAINHSNTWARALVDQPIPVVGNSLNETISRATHAARRAIRRSAIHPDIRGPLDVLPATNFEPPHSATMPWVVTVRFVVQVTPAQQWAVERAIRSALIDEFWDDYGSKNNEPAARELSEASETEATEAQAVAETGVMTKKHRLPKVDVDFDTANKRHPGRQTSQATADISTVDEDEENSTNSANRELLYTSWYGRLFSLGNRIRPTSTALILGTIAVLILRLMFPAEDESTTTNNVVATSAAPVVTEEPAATEATEPPHSSMSAQPSTNSSTAPSTSPDANPSSGATDVPGASDSLASTVPGADSNSAVPAGSAEPNAAVGPPATGAQSADPLSALLGITGQGNTNNQQNPQNSAEVPGGAAN